MNMKKIIALAAVAVATVAGASTNYVEYAVRNHNLFLTLVAMGRDSELADPAAYRATLEAVDRGVATSTVEIAHNALMRRCPLAARAVLGRSADFTKKAREDALAACGYDAPNKPLDLMPGEAGYVNYSLQAACVGNIPAAGIRKGILDAAFGIPVEWEFIQSRILADAELDGLKARLLNGEIPFTPVLQNRLCVALGVEGYNAFVREYNGK